jgi:hypothetical protein
MKKIILITLIEENIIILLLLGAFLMAGCAKNDSPMQPAPVSNVKDITSSWVSSGNPNWKLDFSLFSPIQAFTLKETYGTGGECESQAVVTSFLDQNQEDPDSGIMEITNSQATLTVSGMPPCSQFNGSWAYYFQRDNTLMLCASGGACIDFK